MQRYKLVSDSRRKHGRTIQPTVENLEGRLLLYSATGNHFSNGANISISFVPDGTNLGGVTSNLQSSFNSIYGSAAAWQNAILDAAAYWETVANINFTVITDNGSPTSTGSYQQGDPSKGDIRIGGYAMAGTTLAYTIAPPPANGDSSSGDIFFNTYAQYGGPGGYDLQTVAVHELGHALGLGHSTDSTAAMYATYLGTKAMPYADDVAGIQAIWGPRVPDYYQTTYNNTTFANAADISNQINWYQQIGIPNLNISQSNAPYFFKVTTPANASNQFAAIIQSNTWSLLAPQVQIYSTAKKLLGSNMGNPYAHGDTMGIQINDATPNTTYIIRVMGNTNGPTRMGAYGLMVNMGTWGPGPVPRPANMIPITANQGGGGMAEVAPTSTQQGKSSADTDFDFTQIGTIQSSGDTFTVTTDTKQAVPSKPSKHVQVQKAHPNRNAWAKHFVPMKHRFAFA